MDPSRNTDDYFYELPAASIAQSAIEPRDAARLLDTRSMVDRTISELPALLEPGDVVVVNRTRVRRARLQAMRPTGGRVELLVLGRVGPRRWEALARPSRRLRVGSELAFGSVAARVITDPDAGRIVVEVDADLEELAAEQGEMPLPPYFHGSLEHDDRYQTVYGDRIGSAAAPTAGLHFTDDVLEGLAARDIAFAKVELEVGLDTFRPIVAETLDGHVMHSEQVTVDQAAVDAIEAARGSGGRVVAVGTTVVRSLESASIGGRLEPFEGPTDLFITPGYRFRAVDLVLTNFHVPGSTLVVLVAALLGERWRDVYREALERGYRFLSFGDAMLAEVSR